MPRYTMMNFHIERRGWLIGGAAILIVAASAALIYLGYVPVPWRTVEDSPLGVLRTVERSLQQNPAYVEAEEALMRSSFNPAFAVRRFTDALSAADSPVEEGEIRFRLAVAMSLAGDEAGAIALLKEISLDDTYHDIVRANAAEYLGRIYVRALDPETLGHIFSGDAYGPLAVAGDDSASLRNLYVFAAELYPIADVSSRLAQFDAYDLQALREGSADAGMSRGEDELLESIRVHLLNIDADLLRIRSATYGKLGETRILYRKGIVQGTLDVLGYEGFGNPEETFGEAIRIAAENEETTQQATARYHLAAYLAQKHGSSRAGDIGELLADGLVFSDASLQVFLKNLAMRPESPSWKEARRLAEIDEDFMRHLRFLGWQI